MNQSRAALAAIATVIPIAIIVTTYAGRSALQNKQEHQKITVVASFYPLYEFASKAADNKAEVSSLTPAGVEPHDRERTSEDISKGRAADVLIINGTGFERWANDLEPKVVVNTSDGIELNSKGENETANRKQGQEGNADGDNRIKPHIGLDLIFAKHQVDMIRDAMVRLSPIEGISKEEQAANVGNIDKMKQNVVNLKEGLECI